MTARMHLAMADAFGVEPDRLGDGAYAALVDDVGPPPRCGGPHLGQ